MAEQVSTKPGDLNSDPRAQATAGQEAAPASAILAERGEKGDLQEPSGQLARHKQTWTRERARPCLEQGKGEGQHQGLSWPTHVYCGACSSAHNAYRRV